MVVVKVNAQKKESDEGSKGVDLLCWRENKCNKFVVYLGRKPRYFGAQFCALFAGND